jgi:hypothetical protein
MGLLDQWSPSEYDGQSDSALACERLPVGYRGTETVPEETRRPSNRCNSSTVTKEKGESLDST